MSNEGFDYTILCTDILHWAYIDCWAYLHFRFGIICGYTVYRAYINCWAYTLIAASTDASAYASTDDHPR